MNPENPLSPAQLALTQEAIVLELEKWIGMNRVTIVYLENENYRFESVHRDDVETVIKFDSCPGFRKQVDEYDSTYEVVLCAIKDQHIQGCKLPVSVLREFKQLCVDHRT